MEINDSRSVLEFQKKTFCGHPRAHVRKVLLQNVQLGHADYACYWTLELLCSGLVHSLWDAFFEAAALHINRANPAVFTYLANAYENYMPLESRYALSSMTDIRNNRDARRVVCEVAAAMSSCRKNKLPSLPTLKPAHDFDPVTIQESIKAPSSMYGKIVLRPNDPMPVIVPMNEFCYCIRQDVRDLTRALYWMSWVLTFCREHKKESKMVLPFANRADEFVSIEHGTHPIWIFWDAVRKQASPQARPYVDILYKMHCLRWSPSDKAKRPLMIAAIVLVCESNLDATPVAGNTLAISTLLEGMPRWIDAIQRMQASFSTS